MKPSREEALFALALIEPAAERVSFLDRERSADLALRRRMEDCWRRTRARIRFSKYKWIRKDKIADKDAKVGVDGRTSDSSRLSWVSARLAGEHQNRKGCNVKEQSRQS
jgi:hypothetical protein